MSVINGNGGVSLNHMTSLPIKGFNQLAQLSKKMWNGMASAGITPTQAKLIAGAALALILFKAIQKLSQANLSPPKPKPTNPSSWKVPTQKVRTAQELKDRFGEYTQGIEGATFKIVKSPNDNLQVMFCFETEESRQQLIDRVDTWSSNQEIIRQFGQSKYKMNDNAWQKGHAEGKFTFTLNGAETQHMANIPFRQDAFFKGLMETLFHSSN